MVSLYPIDETESTWVVTYQRNKFSAIKTLFTGNYDDALEFYNDYYEMWG